MAGHGGHSSPPPPPQKPREPINNPTKGGHPSCDSRSRAWRLPVVATVLAPGGRALAAVGLGSAVRALRRPGQAARAAKLAFGRHPPAFAFAAPALLGLGGGVTSRRVVQARPAPKAAYTPARHLSLARDGWPGRALPWHVADAAPELWCGGWTGPPGLIGIASSTHSWSWLKIFFFGGLPFLVSSCFLCIVSRLLEDRAVLAPLSLLYLSLSFLSRRLD